jgi:hypothetical protein
MLVYRAPEGGQPDPSREIAQAWQSFLDSVGPNMKDAGNPVFERTVVGSGTADTVLGGYSIIEADDFDHAVQLAQGVPFLRFGGAVEIGELTRLDANSLVTDAQDHARATNPV